MNDVANFKEGYQHALGETAQLIVFIVIGAGVLFGIVVCWSLLKRSTRVPKAKEFDPEHERRVTQSWKPGRKQ
jgi:hypothetical protein